jgi:hypothetical protein
MTTRPIRWCTGGCKNPAHHAHFYSIDPTDGDLGKEYLCPGNLSEAQEWIENGEETGQGFIPETATSP